MKTASLWNNSRHFLNLRPVYGFGQWMLDNFPLAVGYGMTRGVSEIAYRVGKKVTGPLSENLRQVLRHSRPGLDPAALERTVQDLTYKIFINRGRWFADLSVLAGVRRFDDIVHIRMEGNWDAFTRARREGRGTILASGHLGNWYGGGVAVGRLGIPIRAVIYHNHAGDVMDRRVWGRGSVGPIYIDGDPYSTLEVVRALRSGEAVAMLADRPWDSRWMDLPFFGRIARFPLGPVRIARLAQVPLFPAFCVYERDLDYTATMCDPIEVGPGDPEEAEREAMRRFVAVLEKFVAPNLHVWFSFMPIWHDPP